MEEGDDAYLILGISSTATAAEIKSSYRKMALRHHPDKQKNDDDRKSAHVIFAKISNAYEILGDDQKRRQYDYDRRQHQVPAAAAGSTSHGNNDPFNGYSYGDFESSDDDDDANDGRRRQSSKNKSASSRHHHQQHQQQHRDHHNQYHQQQHQQHHQHPFHFQFHDPFQIFEQVFRDEFGSGGFGGGGGGRPSRNGTAAARSPFDDPFFQSPLGGMGMGGLMGMGGGGLGGGMFPPNSMFGGQQPQRSGDPFGSMMMQQQQMMFQDPFAAAMMSSGPFGNGGTSFVSTSTSSNTMGAGRNGASVSTSTTTRIVNGQHQTVTETIVHNPDGTVERRVETQGSDNRDGGRNDRRLDYSRNSHRRNQEEQEVPQLESGHRRQRNSTDSSGRGKKLMKSSGDTSRDSSLGGSSKRKSSRK
jgi:curved DNA-binding protein CbpA